MLIVTSQLRIPLREFRFSFARSSGPGGQNVNKVSSKAVLRWSPGESPSLVEPLRGRVLQRLATQLTNEGELVIASQRFRDAPRNAADCLEKLRQLLIAASHQPRPRRPTRPTRGSVRRRLEQKQRRSQRKQSRRGPGAE
jgi:ribosome-associated protein